MELRKGMYVITNDRMEIDGADACTLQLYKENQQLKEQLNKKYENVGTLTSEILYEENTKLVQENQQLKEQLERKVKAYDELTDYLKDLLENRYTNGKVVWFDSEYAKIYGELCTMAGAGDTRLALVPLSEIENILSKIEKR